MFKKVVVLLFLMSLCIISGFAQAGTYTTNSYFYLPLYGAYGTTEFDEYNTYMEIADNQIEANKIAAGDENICDVSGAMWTGNTETFITMTYQDADNTVDAVVPVKDEDNMASDSATFLCTQQSIKAYADTLHALQYLKTEIDTKGEVEAIWSLTIPDLTGTPVQYDYGRFTDADTIEGRSYAEVLTDISTSNIDGEISLYVDNAGDDSNSGLSGSPVQTLAQAISNIPAIPREDGTSTTVSIILTAGQTFDIDNLYIQVPWISTLEIKTSTANSVATLEVGNGVKGLIIYRSFVVLTDITIQKRGTGQTHSIYCRDHAHLRVDDNCSFSGATSYEIGLYRSSTCYFQGTLVGDLSAHGIAIHSASYLQMATSADISDYDRGVYFDRGGTGDLNAGVIDNCTNGIHSEDGALAKCSGIDITNCTYGAYAQTGGQVTIASVGSTTGTTTLYGMEKDGYIYYDGVVYRGSHTIVGNLLFEGATADVHETTFSITDPTADRTITVPDNSQTIGVATSGNTTTFTCTDNENEALACPVVFVDGATGSQGAETDDIDFTYNPSTGTIKVTALDLTTALPDAEVANNITIDLATLATTITVTDNEATNENNPICFVAGADPDGGSLGIETDGTMTYNPSTGKITTTGFVGALTGNADTVTTNANLTGIVTSAGNATAIADKAIAIAKLADGTDGELITWDATGVIATVPVGTATHVLTSGGTGVAPTFQAVSATNITVADTTDTTCWVGLWESVTGSQAPKSDGGITYNAGTGLLTSTIITGEMRLTTSNADPDTTAEIKHDSTVTGMSGGALRWYDDNSSRLIVDLETDPSADDYVVAYDSAADGFYMKVDATTGGGAVDTSGTPVDNDFGKFTDADTIEGRSYLETRNDLEMYTWYPQDYATGAGTSGDPWAGSCIEDALSAASAGDTIYLRAGYYQLAGNLDITKAINIIGEGIGKTFVVTANANGFDINTDYVTVKNLTIDGAAQTDGNSGYHCLYISRESYAWIENIETKNAGYYGISPFSVNYCIFKDIYTHDNYRHGIHPGCNYAGENIYNVYQNIYTYDNGNGGFADRGDSDNPNERTHNIYDNIQAWDNGNLGIQIAYQEGFTLSNSLAYSNANIGIDLYSVEDVNVSNCHSYFNDDEGLRVYDSNNVNFTNIIVKNNNVTDAANVGGITVNVSTNISFTSCQSYDSRVVAGTDIAFVDGGAGEDTITQTAADFVNAGFKAGDTITIIGAGQAGNNDTFTIISVIAGTINVATASLTTEAAGASVTITAQMRQNNGLRTVGTSTVRMVNCILTPNTIQITNTTTSDITIISEHPLVEDHDFSGRAKTAKVGESVVFGELLYFDWTATEWMKTDADAAATMPGLRIALESKGNGENCLMLVYGDIRDDSAFAFAGSIVYASCTPGDITSTAPSASGDQVQRVGVAESADIFNFSPSIDVGEI